MEPAALPPCVQVFLQVHLYGYCDRERKDKGRVSYILQVLAILLVVMFMPSWC